MTPLVRITSIVGERHYGGTDPKVYAAEREQLISKGSKVGKMRRRR